MTYRLFAHPFSSYCWKVLIALREKALPFEIVAIDNEAGQAELRKYWPLGKFPVLVEDRDEGGAPTFESTTIIEYLDLRHREPAPLLPANAVDALDVRFMDRIFDNHVMTPMQAIVNEYLIDARQPDPARIAKAAQALDDIYAWLDVRLAERTWACTPGFTLADCAAAPALFYADWVRPIPDSCANLQAYRARLLERPSVARCVEDARPFRPYFPPGAPDRD
jgi:glutathione S-transferase